MNVKSLGYQMDLSFPGFDRQVLDRGDYLVVLTPSNPSYYWGNYLLFEDPPEPSDFIRWRDLFSKEIGNQHGISHQAFGWDSPSGELGNVEPFQKAGFKLLQRSVMTTTEVNLPPHYNRELNARPVVTDAEWEMATRCAASHSESVTVVNEMVKQEMASWRTVTQSNEGEWYGAFLRDTFVGGLGIYTADETGVIDEVVTHPDFRRQGVCRSLVYQASLHAFDHLGVRKLLLAADNGSAAKRIYEQLGFRTVEQQVGIESP